MLLWNQQKKWYWKNEAIDLLTKKNDSNSLELCDNLNLHYNWLFLVKMYHFSAYRVTGVCQKKKKKKKLILNRMQLRDYCQKFSLKAAVEKKKYINLFCSPNLIQIGSRLPLGKMTGFKDVVILFDGLDEVICHDYNKFFVNARTSNSKALLTSSFVA